MPRSTCSFLDNVRIEQRVFDTLAQQHGHALSLCTAEWVLRLDSDWLANPAVFAEIERCNLPKNIGGFRIPFIFALHGRRVRSALYPPVVCLFRRESARYEQDGHTERVRCAGEIIDLSTPFVHDDRKPIDRYFSSQLRYSHDEAQKLAGRREGVPSRFFERTKLMLRAPGLAPLAVFLFLGLFRGALSAEAGQGFI